ncbi:sterol desaturase family protein [Novosphingobium tardum]|uniref:Sterol desaturase family protein n=1 Tax=Novosphingobium tardum TaxID=1538021 RepID=A0ABV8RJP2_9SPHN
MADPHLPDPVQLAVPAFVALMVIEIIAYRMRMRRGTLAGTAGYEPRDTLTSLLLGLGSTIAGALFGGVVIAVFVAVYRYRLFDFGYVWWAWPAAFVLDDLAYYWYHRFGHRIRWFWAAHVIHHTSQHYNLSTALRQTWTGFFTFGLLFRLPLVVIGFPPPLILVVGGINLIYQFWIHTELIRRMPGWFEAVMNTPSHHRVHHAINPRYLDANYAGVFIVWDKLFGTFVPEEERAGEPIRYGVVKQLGSFNVLWAAFHEWIAMAVDVWRAPWGSKLGYMIREPGWSHDGSRDNSERIREKWAARRAATEGAAIAQV